MEEIFYIADRGSLDAATALIEAYGDAAVVEAAAQAQKYRNVGNAVRFCQWRQIERIVSVLSQDVILGTLH
ncbi:MAG: hypothetical protein JWR77_235 [Rhizorhabdus sp.]|nr:hypothetical protein [Rhizorhabdus sp.]